MEQALTVIIGKLLEYGLPGIGLAYLAYNAVQQRRELQERDAHIRKMYEDRIVATAEIWKVLGSNTAANDKLSQSLAIMAEKLNDIADLIKK